MHRSGTSLLTRVLLQAGFFMGIGASRNEEAAFTNAVNTWLFRQASASWDHPEPVYELLNDDYLRPWLVDYMRGIVRGPASLRFLGMRRWARYGSMLAQKGPWGWKDPRNTFTLPMWLDLFPDAKVLHIVRHGVDVAASLQERRKRVVDENLRRYDRFRHLYHLNPLAPKRRGLGPQPRVRNLDGGFALWCLYMRRATIHTEQLGARALTLRYEDLLTDPIPWLDSALRFCGCQPTESMLQAAVADLRPSRAFAWANDPVLRQFAATVRDSLRPYGYTDEVPQYRED